MPTALARPKLGREFVMLVGDLQPMWDFFCILLAGYLASAIHALFFAHNSLDIQFWDAYGQDALVGALIAPFILHDKRQAPSTVQSGAMSVLSHMLGRFMTYCGVMLAIGFATRALDFLPRSWVGFWIGFSFFFTLTTRLVLSRQLRMLEQKGILRESIAVVGAGPVADRLIRHLRRVRPSSVEIVGIYDDRERRSPGDAIAANGHIEDLIELGKSRPIDWILVTFPWTAENRLLSLTHKLKTLSVPIALCPQQVGLNLPYHTLDFVGDDLPVTLLADKPLRRWNAVLKSAEDFLLGGLLTLMLAPVFALIALAVRLDSPGPIFFKQRRLGWNNKEFEIYKFRTMRWDPNASVGGDALKQTERNDTRITRIGNFLRRSSLDELPQLFNVLRGEMSLVGPRPHAVNMRTEQQLGHEIIEVYAHRHRVKPGITGWAQVNGYRGATQRTEQLRKRVEYDIHYIENCSLLFDLKILVMTFFGVLKGTNAY